MTTTTRQIRIFIERWRRWCAKNDTSTNAIYSKFS